MRVEEVTGTIPDVARKEAPSSAALGRAVRSIRESRNISATELAKMTGLHKSQISKIEKGENVEVKQYESIARALNFRHALEMFRAGPDPQTRQLLRYWARLSEDEAARRDVLEQVKGTLARSEE